MERYESVTSLRQRHELDEVHAVIDPSINSDYPTPEILKPIWSRHPSSKSKLNTGECTRNRYDSSSSSDEEGPGQQYITVSVKGADNGDLPTEYTVEGLRPDEFPVIGTYVDKRIVPGFRYRVRKLGYTNPERYLFNAEPLTLQSIGRGYGKRITFEGEFLNDNTNYFYSDTNAAGFGLSLVAVEADDLFTVTAIENMHPLAEAKIVSVLEEKELSSYLEEDKILVKEVRVTVWFDIAYVGGAHGMLPIYLPHRLRATGIARVERLHRAEKAFTTCINDIEIPHHGLVVFRA
jgi:hypothetical protein